MLTASVIIYFVEIEPADETFFRRELAGNDIRFVPLLAAVGEDAEVLSVFINSTVDEAFVRAHPNLRHIATRSGLADHIDLAACQAAGISVSNVPDYGDTTVAEHTFALILALSRRLREVMAHTQHAQPSRFSYEAARGCELAGKTLGLIGLGRIGRRVLKLSHAFGMCPVAYDPVAMPPEVETELGFRWLSLEDLLAQADIITLHVRLSPRTHHLLNRQTLAQCRSGVLIVNTARGALIDTEALSEALDSGQVGGAGLDVLEEESVLRESASHVISAQIVENLRSDAVPHEIQHEARLRHLQNIMKSDALLARPNVVFTPHVAFNSVEAMERLYTKSTETLRAFLRGEPVNLVTSP